MTESPSNQEDVSLVVGTSAEWQQILNQIEVLETREWPLESTPNRPSCVVTLNGAMRKTLGVEEGEIVQVENDGGHRYLSIVRKAPEAMAGRTVLGVSSRLGLADGTNLKTSKIKLPPEVERRMRQVQTTGAKDDEAKEFADRKQKDPRFASAGLPGVCLPKSLRIVLGSAGKELEVGGKVLVNGKEHIVLPFTSDEKKWADGIVFLTSDSTARADQKLLIAPIPPQAAS